MKMRKMFGLWDSPVTTDMLAGQKRLNDVKWSREGRWLVWAEGRGAQGVLLAQPFGQAAREVSGNVNVRGAVGYGGGEFDVHHDFVVFVGDGRLWRAGLAGGAPKPITPAMGLDLAAPTISPDGRWVVYVFSDGKHDGLGVVDAHGKQWPQKIVVGADFYMQPAFSHDGSRLAWVAWDQPNMPWDGTRLEVADVVISPTGFRLGDVEVLAGGPSVAVQQPVFSPDGRYLAYISDEPKMSHVFLRSMADGMAVQLTQSDADYSGPAWVQGLRYLAWAADSTTLIACRNDRGVSTLVALSLEGRETELPAAPTYEWVGQPSVSIAGDIAFIGSASRIPPRVVTLVEGLTPQVNARATAETVASGDLSSLDRVHWTVEGKSVTTQVFGNYYPPANPRFEGHGKPPAIVMIHGGPTTQATATYNARNQFFATRGFALLAVNYRGSTGYGRHYQDALYGNWGVADVEDAVSAAKYLGEAGLADPSKIVIMGGSAGGYTVLQCLTDHPGVFKAGVCMYGIANLFTLAMGTHKFEAAYNDMLFGALPEAADVYRERSPIFKADRISDALAVYHGAEDRVVPIDQAELIVAALKRRGVPHEYHKYDNEGHGWRRPENIDHFYSTLLDFLKQHVLFA